MARYPLRWIYVGMGSTARKVRGISVHISLTLVLCGENGQICLSTAACYTQGAVHPVTAIYPGSFDPVTHGHLDLVARGARLFDRLVVAVLRNDSKHPLFSVAERVEMLRTHTAAFPNVEIATFDGLLVDFARAQQAQAVLRGIRAISDYEYELQMAHMNRRLHPELETVFLMPDAQYSYVSSRLVKEVFRLGGSVEGLVPQLVIDRLAARSRQG